jgi:hypothetical protein
MLRLASLASVAKAQTSAWCGTGVVTKAALKLLPSVPKMAARRERTRLEGLRANQHVAKMLNGRAILHGATVPRGVRAMHALARGMTKCTRADARGIFVAAHSWQRGMAYHRDGMTKIPAWVVNLVVGVVGVGAMAVLFTVGRKFAFCLVTAMPY